MVASPKIPGLEVTVRVADETAVEYDDASAYEEPQTVELDSPNGVRIIKYIEAKPGARFGVRVRRTEEFQGRSSHIAATVSVDGGPTWAKQELGSSRRRRRRNSTWVAYFHRNPAGSAETGYSYREWTFDSLNIEPADTRLTAEEIQRQTSVVKSLGVIFVQVFHMDHCNQTYDFRQDLDRLVDVDETSTIHEKALKGRALSVRSSFQSSPSGPPGEKATVMKYHDAKSRPFAVFEFRYRTREDLVKEAILRPDVLRTPHAGNLEAPLMLNDDGGFVGSGATNSMRPKPEPKLVKSEDDAKPSADIKRERGGSASGPQRRSFKQRRLPSGRFEVDLTQDDSDEN